MKVWYPDDGNAPGTFEEQSTRLLLTLTSDSTAEAGIMGRKIVRLVMMVTAALAVGFGAVDAAGHVVDQHPSHHSLADDTGPTNGPVSSSTA